MCQILIWSFLCKLNVVMDWQWSPISVFVVFLNFSSHVSGHQRGGLSVGDFLGSWRAVPLSTFPPVTWPVRFFTMTYCVDFLLFPPGSTQVFAIKLLQNVFPGGFCYVFDFLCDSFGCFCQFLVIEVSFRLIFGYLGFLSPYCLSFVAEKSLFFL